MPEVRILTILLKPFSPPFASPYSHALLSSLDVYSETLMGSLLPTLQCSHGIKVWSALCLPHRTA